MKNKSWLSVAESIRKALDVIQNTLDSDIDEMPELQRLLIAERLLIQAKRYEAVDQLADLHDRFRKTKEKPDMT